MAYTLTYSGGTISITEGTVNTTKTSLALPGHNYVNYGQQVDQNMLSLLENFASNTSGPPRPIKGQLWFDSANVVLKYNTNNTTPNWVPLSTAGANAAITADSITANTFISLGHYEYSIADGISATGTNQATAAALTKDINRVSSVASGANGVKLPTPATTGGYRITVINADGSDTLNVYPSTSAQINNLGAGTPLQLTAGSSIDFICTSSVQWYTLTATYS